MGAAVVQGAFRHHSTIVTRKPNRRRISMDMTREYFLSTFQLSQDPTEPIYSQLAEYLR